MPEIILNPDRYTAANPVPHGRSSGDHLPSDSCLLEVSTDGVMVNLNGSVLDGENTINPGSTFMTAGMSPSGREW